MVVWVMQCKKCEHIWQTHDMRGNENPYALSCPNILSDGKLCKHDELIRLGRADDVEDIDDLIFG